MGRGLHGGPGAFVSQDPDVIPQPDELDLFVRAVGPVVGEGKPHGPDQREDVDRKEEKDRRRHEEPCDRPVGKATDLARDGQWF